MQPTNKLNFKAKEDNSTLTAEELSFY